MAASTTTRLPPAAVAPGDSTELTINGFTFEQLGVRVPAVVVSPFIPKNTVDHTVYDHTSILATLEALLGVDPLTQRDAAANNLTGLISLSVARTDTPTQLPAPAASSVSPEAKSAVHVPFDPNTPIEGGDLRGFLFVAAKVDAELAGKPIDQTSFAKARSLKTHGEAKVYFEEVMARVLAHRAATKSR